MMRSTRMLNLVCACLVVVASASGCGGGGSGSGGGSGNGVGGTTSSTTTSTTLADTSSTTTLGGGGDSYTITFSLDDAVTIGSLQLEVDYSSAGGEFAGSAAAVSCTAASLPGGVLASFNDIDTDSQLNYGMISGASVAGPTMLADCTFVASGPAPQADDFVITVVEAYAPDFAPIVPLPVVSVSAVTPE